MLTKILGSITAASPNVKRVLWKGWYQFLAGGYRQEAWTFMNYGFADIDEGKLSFPLSDSDEPDRYGIQLYHAVVSDVDLRGRDVLEVGSGRGGGSSFLARYLHPQSVTGVDFSDNAVELSKKRFTDIPGLTFKQGDAESLPFPDAAFDIVVNVESSHCYASMDRFLAEVARVLRPGGYFCWTDMLQGWEIEPTHAQFARAGLVIVREEDITPNVLLGLDRVSDRKRALMDKHIPRFLHRYFADFAGVPGTRVYEGFRTGKVGYWRCTLQKPK